MWDIRNREGRTGGMKMNFGELSLKSPIYRAASRGGNKVEPPGVESRGRKRFWSLVFLYYSNHFLTVLPGTPRQPGCIFSSFFFFPFSSESSGIVLVCGGGKGGRNRFPGGIKNKGNRAPSDKMLAGSDRLMGHAWALRIRSGLGGGFLFFFYFPPSFLLF